MHVRGRVGDMHGFVASGDTGEDVDLAADFRADEAGGQADAPLTVADEGHLREEPTGMSSPVRADKGAVVGASPRQAHDVDATAHRPRARAIAADVEHAIGLACGFVAGPGGPRVNADAREGFLLVNVLGRQVGEARARANGRSRDGVDGVGQALFVWCREREGGSDARVTQASPSGVPVKIEQSGVGEHARDRIGVRGPGRRRGWWLARGGGCRGRSRL